MEVNIRPRQSGRTTAMLNWLSERHERILLTFDDQEAERLRKLVKREITVNTSPQKTTPIGLDGFGMEKRIFSWRQYLSLEKTMRISHITEIGIDNADYILGGYIQNRIKVITMTDDEIDTKQLKFKD